MQHSERAGKNYDFKRLIIDVLSDVLLNQIQIRHRSGPEVELIKRGCLQSYLQNCSKGETNDVAM